MVHHHVAQRSHGVVEVPAVLDAERLRHRDLHRCDLLPVPQRLQHRVPEAQDQQLLEAHLAEEVVDPVKLRLVQVLVQLGCKCARRRLVVAERLLDDHAGTVQQPRLGQAADDPAEQERRDLEVEDGRLDARQGLPHLLVGGGVVEVALVVGEPCGKPVEHGLVDGLSGRLDAVVGVLAEAVDAPVVGGDADDRAVQQAPSLEAVERVQRHHPGQVAGDAEHHERPGVCRAVVARACAECLCSGHAAHRATGPIRPRHPTGMKRYGPTRFTITASPPTHHNVRESSSSAPASAGCSPPASCAARRST